MRWMPLALLFLVLALAACDLDAEDESTPVATAAVVTATATTPAVQESTPEITDPLPPVTQGITLTIWTTTEIAPNNDVPGGSILLEQLSAFDNDHPDVNIFVELKTIAEQGGILSYLRTGRAVAPGILPDVILLPSSQLQSAAGQGLIFPVEQSLVQDVLDDLYPAAREMVEAQEAIYGVPFALTNLNHIVYDTSQITETISTNWTQLINTRPGVFVYPAGGPAGAALTAHFYRQLGGTFVDDLGRPTLQSEPLLGSLELIQQAVNAGLIDPQSGSISNLQQAWQIFEESPERIVQTNANFLLARRAAGARANLRMLPLPGPGGALTSTVGALTWAVSTPDPERQAVAVELINWLVSAPNLGAWSMQSHYVPARRTAFEEWPSDAYTAFLQRQVSSARPEPPGLSITLLTTLSEATTTVILGLASPADTVQDVISDLGS